MKYSSPETKRSRASRTSRKLKAPNSFSTWLASIRHSRWPLISRVLGHLTIVGLGNAALPVNFNSPAKECSVASTFWGTIPELIEVISLAQTGKIKMLVEHFALDDAAHAYHLLHDGKIQGRAVITPSD
jgi:D-arabinose 1-dehydrogenase-like Zn-dependent alcohol dehydrogenase